MIKAICEKIFIGFLASFLLGLGFSQSANAHVLIQDDSKSVGAVLHVNPDDDPIAGKASELSLELQTILPVQRATLTISDGQSMQTVPLTAANTAASGHYTFPSQGVYGLTFTTATANKTYSFHFTQRVSRGVNGQMPRQTHAWADIMLIACGSLLAVLLVLAVVRRVIIVRNSKL